MSWLTLGEKKSISGNSKFIFYLHLLQYDGGTFIQFYFRYLSVIQKSEFETIDKINL